MRTNRTAAAQPTTGCSKSLRPIICEPKPSSISQNQAAPAAPPTPSLHLRANKAAGCATASSSPCCATNSKPAKAAPAVQQSSRLRQAALRGKVRRQLPIMGIHTYCVLKELLWCLLRVISRTSRQGFASARCAPTNASEWGSDLFRKGHTERCCIILRILREHRDTRSALRRNPHARALRVHKPRRHTGHGAHTFHTQSHTFFASHSDDNTL